MSGSFLDQRRKKYGTSDGKPPKLPPVVPSPAELSSDWRGIVVQSADWRVIVVQRDFPSYLVLVNDPLLGGWRYAADGFTRDIVGFYLDNCHFQRPSPEFFERFNELPNLPVFPSE